MHTPVGHFLAHLRTSLFQGNPFALSMTTPTEKICCCTAPSVAYPSGRPAPTLLAFGHPSQPLPLLPRVVWEPGLLVPGRKFLFGMSVFKALCRPSPLKKEKIAMCPHLHAHWNMWSTHKWDHKVLDIPHALGASPTFLYSVDQFVKSSICKGHDLQGTSLVAHRDFPD